MQEISDKELLTYLSEGRKQAYEELFRRYWAKVYHYVATVIGVSRASSAEDLSQNVFLKLWTHRRILPHIKSLNAYLFTVSSNEARDFLRHQKVSQKYATDVLLSDEYIDHLDLWYDYDLISSAIDACVEQMPPKRKEIWQLSRNSQLDNRQIARRLGISKRTVERHISMALDDIRAVLDGLVPV